LPDDPAAIRAALARSRARLSQRLRLRRALLNRSLIGLALVTVVGLALSDYVLPGGTTAIPAGPAPTALPATAFRTIVRTDQPLRAPIDLVFDRPMDEASVAAALAVTPATPVELRWDVAGTRLTVSPRVAWEPGAYIVVTVGTTARDATGQLLAAPARAAFLTRGAAAARLVTSAADPSAAPADTTFSVIVDGAVDAATARGAVRIDPPIAGTIAVEAVDEPGDPGQPSATRILVTPSTPLKPSTTYTFSLAAALVDLDGAVVPAPAPLAVTTDGAPSIVRVRPVGGSSGVAAGSELSVRFDRPMDRSSSEAAFHATIGSSSVRGSLSWAENDTVLVLHPAAALMAGATVRMSIDASARSAAGFALGDPLAISFSVARPATPTPAPRRATAHGSSSGSGSGGSGSGAGTSVGAGSWTALESWYLSLMNCERGGGLVTSAGGCSSPGGSGLRPLKLDAGISSKVSRPYAKYIADRSLCNHFYDGAPVDRLARAGYRSWSAQGENIACYNGGSVKHGILWGALAFQSERASNGPHWRNIMDPHYDRAGVGIWVSAGRIRLVIDFFHP